MSHEESFWLGDLVPSADVTRVEYFGGPYDGDFRSVMENGLVAGGHYVPINSEYPVWRCVGKRFVVAADTLK